MGVVTFNVQRSEFSRTSLPDSDSWSTPAAGFRGTAGGACRQVSCRTRAKPAEAKSKEFAYIRDGICRQDMTRSGVGCIRMCCSPAGKGSVMVLPAHSHRIARSALNFPTF